ncbi:MAG: 6-phosphogluconolactonase [Ignavibacterium sp.]
MNYDLKIFHSLIELSEYFAKKLNNQVDFTNSKYNLALSGGSTPKYIYKYLAENFSEKIEWSKINFFWGDERCIPPTDDESNYKTAYDNLLSKISIPEENIFRIKGENNPEAEAKSYSEKIRVELPQQNQLPQFDLIMLGLGEDGHTASIFPDQMNLLNENKICSVAIHPTTKQKRITLTGKVINNARNVVFIVTGKNKSKIVDDLLNHKQDSKKYPASFIKPVNGSLFWLLDIDAAGLLKGN